MDKQVNKTREVQTFGTPSDVVASYTRCECCDAYLHFSHVTDFARCLTQEVVRCPECNDKPRRVVHRLQ